jgi:hypothetical protein
MDQERDPMIETTSAFQASECVRRPTRRETGATPSARPPATARTPRGGALHADGRAVSARSAGDRSDGDDCGTGHLASRRPA